MASGFRDLLAWLLGWKSDHRAVPRAYRLVRIGEVTEVTLLDPPAGTLYYHWYRDGAWLGYTLSPTRSFHVLAGEQVQIDCIPTAYPAFNPIANAPAGYPARRTLWWIRSTDADVESYLVEQQEGTGAWSTLAQVANRGEWTFSVVTEPLADLTEYTWRITPIDAVGNDGTPIVIGPERIVRKPDAPNFTATFDPDTQEVLFSLAN